MIKISTFASDSYKEVTDLTFPYMPEGTIIYKLTANGSLDFGTPEFNQLGTTEETDMTKEFKELSEGDILFHIDSDVLVNAPASWFIEQLGENDIIFQSDQGTCCLGFWVARVNKRVIDAFELTKKYTGHVNNQVVFNALLPGLKEVGLKVALFNELDVFTYGALRKGVWNGEIFELPENIKAFHANYTIGTKNKRRLLEYATEKYKKGN